ncbi:MAG: cytochrome c oxidase subunit II [Bacteroidota bacterium]
MGTKLIILLVIVLGAIAIAQLARVYELSNKLLDRKEHEISNRDNIINARLMLLFGILFFVGVIYLFVHYGWAGRGDAATPHGRELDWLMNINLIIITAIFFLTNGLLFYFGYKHVKKPGVKALYYPHNNKLELLWTVVPAIVLAVIIILGLRSWNSITGDADKEAIRLELFSKQFDWTARYAGLDNQLGNFDYKLTTDKNELALLTTNTIDSAIFVMQSGPSGIDSLEAKLNNRKLVMVPEDREKMETDLSRKTRLIRLLHQMKARHNAKLDAAAWDDIIQKDTLYLCTNKEYEMNFRSKDVIHSAHFPYFRAQMNTVPGLTTRFKFTPDVTTKQMRDRMGDPKFNYVLLCNKICGGSHYKMKMIVVVLGEKEYKKWYEAKQLATFKNSFFGAPVTETVTPAAASDTLAVMADTLTLVKK